MLSFLPLRSCFSHSTSPGGCSHPPGATDQVPEGGSQAGRKVLGQREGPAGPWQVYSCLPWRRVQPTCQGQRRPRLQFPSLPDSKQRSEPRTVSQAVSLTGCNDPGDSQQQSLLSNQFHFVPNTGICTQQDRRKQTVPLK